MVRKLWAVAAAGGLALMGPASAGDDAMKLGRFQPGEAGFAGGTGGANPTGELTAPEDTERVFHRWGYRPYWGGYNAGFYGYRSFAHSSWPVYGGYTGFYRPGFAVYSVPRFYTPAFAYPVYSYPAFGSFGFGYGYYSAGFFPINGTNVSVNTPAVSLNLSIPSRAPVASAPVPLAPPRPAAPAPGTFQYDGGPANPVPQPVPDAIPPAKPSDPVGEASAIRISRAATTAKTAYKYAAYGEKRN